MGQPKLSLRFTLIDDIRLNIELVFVTQVYTKAKIKSKLKSKIEDGLNVIFTSEGWAIKVSDFFAISTVGKIIQFDNTGVRSNQYLTFFSDEDRYNGLLSLKKALLEWSDDKMFKKYNFFDNKPHIKYHKNIWLIY